MTDKLSIKMGSFGCPLCCHQVFNSVVALREHLLYFTFRPLLCVLCGVTIGGIYELTRHLERHLISDKNPKSEYIENKIFTNEVNNFHSTNVDIRNQCLQGVVSEEDLSNSLPDTPTEYENQYKGFIPKTEKTASLANNFEETNIQQQLSSGQPDNTGKTNSTTNYICWKTSPESINQPVVLSKSDTCSDENFGMETLSILNSYDEMETLDQVEPPIVPKDLSTKRLRNEDSHTERPTVRAFVCNECGIKIVGKDYYFDHLKEHSFKNFLKEDSQCQDLISSTDSFHANDFNCAYNISEHITSDQINNNKVDFPVYTEIGNNNNNNNNNNNDDDDEHLPINTDIQSTSLIETPSYVSETSDILDLTREDCQNVHSEYKSENVTSCLKPPINTMTSSSQHKPYIHKKFDHDHERKFEGISSDRDVQCYIQNFQSLLVNKLNEVSETGAAASPISVTSGMIFASEAEKKNTECENDERNSNQYHCKYCSKKFVWKQTRDTHELNRRCSVIKNCRYCDKKFAKSNLLERHEQEVHSGLIHYCDICGRHFKSLRFLTNHKGVHDSKRFNCKQCEYVAHTASGLRSHIFEHHSSKLKEIVCEYCGENFKRKYGLKRHLQRKHNSQKYFCRYCDKEFSCEADLSCHLKTHLDSESFRCKICDITFSSQSSLKRHTSEKHSHPSKTFKCNTCLISFSRKDSLLSHLKLHSKDRKYVCKCGKGFNKLSHLKYHSVKHSKEPLYHCGRCSKSYKFKTSLRTHKCEDG